MRVLPQAAALVAATVFAGSTSALAAGPSGSPLPGYPRFGGVMLVHDGSAATASEQRAIASALAQRASSGGSSAGFASPTSPDCLEKNVNPGADLCWWGGPVVRSHAVHLIFWEGLAKERPFPAGYVEAVERYFFNVAALSGSATNVYAVGSQYGDQSGPGEYKVKFGGGADVYKDIIDRLPAPGSTATACEDPAEAAKGEPCITDNELREEIKRARALKSAEGWGETLGEIYFVFTPPKVGSCFYDNEEAAKKGGNVCAFAPGGYCGYHSDFEGASEEPTPPLYANIPDAGNVEGCDNGEHPNGPSGVDATLDVVSHEHNETITDPLVQKGWTDVIGQEVGDKCLPPETFNIYGGFFNSLAGGLYNEIIGSGHYILQREWSNSAFAGEGGCVQRMLPTSFSPPSEAKATVPTTFDGALAGETGDPAVYWEWDFGDEMSGGEFIAVTNKPTISHTYASQGTYSVTLTAFDAYGNSNTYTTTVGVGAAPPPVAPPPAPEPITLTKTVNVLVPVEPIAYSAAVVAQKLGLPANGTRLSGVGTITLGHAECPPACTVVVRLYAIRHALVKHVRITKRVFIGALTTAVAAKGTGSLALTLNATGRKLLAHGHRLPVQLTVTVTGKEGGSWQIVRKLTLTSSGRAARSRRR